MWSVILSPDNLALIVGVLLSLLFSYAPGFAGWFNAMAADAKRLLMLMLLALASIAIFAMACGGLLAGVECTKVGAMELIRVFVLAMIANKSTHQASPRVGLKA